MVRQDRGIGTMLGYISYELQGTRLDGDVLLKKKKTFIYTRMHYSD